MFLFLFALEVYVTIFDLLQFLGKVEGILRRAGSILRCSTNHAVELVVPAASQ